MPADDVPPTPARRALTADGLGPGLGGAHLPSPAAVPDGDAVGAERGGGARAADGDLRFSGNLVDDVAAVLDLERGLEPSLSRQHQQRRLLSFYELAMEESRPLGADRPGQWSLEPVHAVRCLWISLDILLVRRRGRLVSVSDVAGEDSWGAGRDLVTYVRNDGRPMGRWYLPRWEHFRRYLVLYGVADDEDLALWRQLYDVVAADFAEHGPRFEGREVLNVNGLRKRGQRDLIARIADHSILGPPPWSAAEDRPEVPDPPVRDPVGADIRSEFGRLAAPDPAELASPAALPAGVQGHRRRTGAMARRVAAVAAVVAVGGGGTLVGLVVSDHRGGCPPRAVGSSSHLLPASYTGAVYVEVCGPPTPRPVSLTWTWGAKHMSAELAPVGRAGRSVYTFKTGHDATPATVVVSPPERVVWGLGAPAGALDVSADWAS